MADAFLAARQLRGARRENYSDLFDLMMSLVGTPDLMIYIRSSIPNLISQISKRGRDFEQSIRIDYLTTIKAALDYYFLPGLRLGVTYQFGYNFSDISSAQYAKHTALLNFSYEY